MELDELWTWKTRRLACRIREETGNPAGDDLRERFAELGGIDLKEVMTEMKNAKKKREAADKLATDPLADTIFKNIESRSHLLGATARTLQEMEAYDAAHKVSFNQNNINKVFSLLPKTPSKRLLKDIQRERARPLRLPDQDEVNQAQLKLQRKMQRDRAIKKKELEGLNTDSFDRNETTINGSQKPLDKVFPKYEGDQFGSYGAYLESMLYQSRLKNILNKTTRYIPPNDDGESKPAGSSDDAPSGGRSSDKPSEIKKSKEDSVSSLDAEQELGNSDFESSKEIESKLYCAICLCDWARDPLNAHRLADEGAVKAISQLFLEPNLKISHFCAAAFCYMSEQLPLALKMIEEGIVVTIEEISHIYSNDEFILSNLTMTMVNLTRHGHEAQLVESGLVLSLTNMIRVKPDLCVLCVRGLYNLTCVDSSYHNIERVIRELVSIANSSPIHSVRHICAASLCNLSDLKAVRPRLVEEGVINCLPSIFKGGETRTRRICAIILQNLSASKSIRVEIVSRNGVSVAYALSSDDDPVILRAIGLTLSRLSKELSSNAQRFITENGITAVTNIAILMPKVPSISQPMTLCFRYLSTSQICRINMVDQAGGVAAIGVLLRNSEDIVTLQNILIALANLLNDKGSHTAVLQQDITSCLHKLSSHENSVIKDLITLVISKFIINDKSYRALINNKIPKLINDLIKQISSTISKRRCAIALCRLTNYTPGISSMVEQQTIDSLQQLLATDDTETIHNICFALCKICSTEENCKLILGAGLVSPLVAASALDITTSQYCLAVLSMLSYYECARSILIESGIMAVLKSSSLINDDITNQRCLLTYANLSCDPNAQEKMVEDDVIKVASRLAESYHETNYVSCAKVMCNLACNPLVCDKIAKQGGVYALLMISIVHSVENDTKLLCAMALNNLLNANSVDTLLQEDLISAMVHLYKINDDRILLICSKILNQISLYSRGRAKLAEKLINIHMILDIANSRLHEARIIASRTACNIVLDPEVRSEVCEYGIITALERGIMLDDDGTTLLVLKAVYSTCCDEKLMKLIASGTLPSFISKAGVKHKCSEFFNMSVAILEELSLSKVSRNFLQNAATAGPIIYLISSELPKESVTSILKIIRLLVNGYGNHRELIDLGLLQSLVRIHTVADDKGLLLISQIYRILCTSENCIECVDNLETLEVLSLISTRLESDPLCLTNLSIIFLAVQKGRESPCCMLVPNAIPIILKAAAHKQCFEYVLAFIGIVLNNPQTRQYFLRSEVINFIAEITLLPLSEATAYNCSRVVYFLANNAAIRQQMIAPEFGFDQIFNRLLNDPNLSVKMKNAYNNTLKKLSADQGGAIEEGIVTKLILTALDTSKKKNEDDGIMIPVIPLLVGSFVWTGEKPSSYDNRDSQWSCDFPTLLGGSAAKGPEAPNPPPLEFEDTDKICVHLMEEVEVADSEGKSKMAFAKMSVPNDFKASFSFSDKQFAEAKRIKEDSGQENSSQEGLDSTSSEIGGNFPREESILVGESVSSVASTSTKEEKRQRSKSAGGIFVPRNRERTTSHENISNRRNSNKASTPVALKDITNSAPDTTVPIVPKSKRASKTSNTMKEGIAGDKMAAKLDLYN